MTKLLSLLCLSSYALGYYVPPLESRNEPAPLSFDFTVEKTFGGVPTRDFWAQQNAVKTKRTGVSATIDNAGDVYYMMNIYLGSNKQKNYVVLDTGSADLWVPSSGYSQNTSSTAQNTGKRFGIRYIDGSVSQGSFYLDTMQLEGSSFELSDFQFAVSGVDGPGVLGIGNRGKEAAQETYDNFPWALQKAGVIPKASYSLFLGRESGSGVVIFGGIDTEKYEGCLTKYPVHISGGDLDLVVSNVSVGGKEVALNSPYTLDSGSSLCFGSAELMSVIDEVFSPSVVNMGGVFYRMISCTQPADQYMEFDFGLNKISVSYADMVLHNDDGTCILGFAYSNGNQVLGDVFLRSAYVYYDLTDQTIALAQARYTETSNVIAA